MFILSDEQNYLAINIIFESMNSFVHTGYLNQIELSYVIPPNISMKRSLLIEMCFIWSVYHNTNAGKWLKEMVDTVGRRRNHVGMCGWGLSQPFCAISIKYGLCGWFTHRDSKHISILFIRFSNDLPFYPMGYIFICGNMCSGFRIIVLRE